MKLEFDVPGAHIKYTCPKCDCDEFVQLDGSSFSCFNCAEYFENFDALIKMEGNATYKAYIEKMTKLIVGEPKEETIDELIDRKLAEKEESTKYRAVAGGRGVVGMTIAERKRLIHSNPFKKDGDFYK